MKQYKNPIFTGMIILLLLIISCRKPTAPSDQESDILWTKTYGGSNQDRGYSVQQTSDGGYIIAGWTESFGAGGEDVYLIKTDSLGDSLWTKTYGYSSSDFGYSVQQTTDGGYIIVGCTYPFGAAFVDVYLIKTDADGNPLWTNEYGGEFSDLGHLVQQTSDGGYIIAGWTTSFGLFDFDIYVLKTNSNGDTLWTKTYGGPDFESGTAVQQTSDGGYIISGATKSFGPGDGDVYLIKTDENGDTLWTRTYGGTSDDIGNFVQETPDGGYIVVGYTSSFGAGGYDVYLIKTDENGDTLWTRTYGGTEWDLGKTVQQTSDGGYIIVGWTKSFGTGDHDVYLIKTDAEGNNFWTRTYGGTGDDRGNSVQQTSDGGYIVAGSTESFGAGSEDVYLIKIKP